MAKIVNSGNGGRLQRMDETFGWDPFEQFSQARRTMNSLLDSVMGSNAGNMREWTAPALDLYEKDGKYVIEAALPGVSKEDIEIEVADNALSIKANKTEEKEQKDARYFYREVRRGGLARTVTFPQDIDSEHVEADYQNGVLKISVPTTAPMKAKKVEIKG